MTDSEIIGVILGILGIAVGIIFGLPAFLPWVSDNIPLIKKINYWLINKRIKIKISSMRKYPIFPYTMIELQRYLNQQLCENGKKIENFLFGNNYIELLLTDSQAPFRIMLAPEILDSNDSEESIKRLEVSINLVGTIDFRYRNDLDNRKYLETINELFQLIEKKYGLGSTFENYSIKSSLTDFNETWDICSTKTENGSIIRIGKKVLEINTKQLMPLYDLYKKNVSNI
jgi:hypothetical protein